MTNTLLSEGSTIKAKEAKKIAFLLTDVAIQDGMSRVDVVGYLADAGAYTTEDGMVYGMDGSGSRNERVIFKVVAHLGDSSHKHHSVALSQLAEAWPSSRIVSCELDAIGAYSYNEGGQLMANASIMPFGGAPSLEVAYVAGVSLITNMYTAERMEAFTRSLLYPTITAISMDWRRRRNGGSRSKVRLPLTRACRWLSVVSTAPRQHAAARSCWRWRRWLLRLVSCTK